MRTRTAVVMLLGACGSSGPEPQGPAQADEVWIPAGSFQMGHAPIPSGTAWSIDFSKVHTVTLPAFFIDRFEVTNEQYRRCFEANECPDELPGWPGYTFRDPRLAKYPFATLASHEAADAYCRWMGKRLPTEAEWERAARGPSSFDYPWGNAPPDCARVHCERPRAASPFNHYYAVGDDLDDVSPDGVHGMLTGVLETVHDVYDENYYAVSPATNPQGPSPNGMKRYAARGNWYGERADMDHLSFNGIEHPLPAWIRTHWGGYGTGIRCGRSDSKTRVTPDFFKERQRLMRGERSGQ